MTVIVDLSTGQRLDQRPHFAGCDFIIRGLASDPSFKFPCTCGEIFERKMKTQTALDYLQAHPEEQTSR